MIPPNQTVQSTVGGLQWLTRIAVATSTDDLTVPWWLIDIRLLNPPPRLMVPSLWSKRQWATARSIGEAVLVGDQQVERAMHARAGLMLVRRMLDDEVKDVTLDDDGGVQVLDAETNLVTSEPLYPVQLLGGPAKELWHRGLDSARSADPCANPRRGTVARQAVRIDCGKCGACVARLAADTANRAAFQARKARRA